MLRDNLWYCWCAMEFVKWKSMCKVYQAVIQLQSLLLLHTDKTIELSTIHPARKDSCCVSSVSLSHWNKAQISLLGTIGFPTIRDSKGSCERKKCEDKWIVRQLWIQRESRLTVRQNFKKGVEGWSPSFTTRWPPQCERNSDLLCWGFSCVL